MSENPKRPISIEIGSPIEDIDNEPLNKATSPFLIDEDTDKFSPKPGRKMVKYDYYGSDLDLFLHNVYKYFEEKGYLNIILKECFGLFVHLFIIIISFVLSNCINYEGLSNCNGIECSEINIVKECIFCDFNFFNYVVTLFCVVYSLHFLFVLYRSFFVLYNFYKVKKFYNKELLIGDYGLKNNEFWWYEVVDKIVSYNKSSYFSSNELDIKDVINRIMRIDNYIIALQNEKVLSLKIPLLNLFFKKGKISEGILNESLIYNLRLIIKSLFKNYRIRNEVYSDPNLIKRLFYKYGLLNLIISPFAFFFMLIKVFFKYLGRGDGYTDMLLKRRWSTIALWKFRGFNELPYQFNKRIAKSHIHANNYCDQFPNQTLSLVAKFVIFFTSAFGAIILVITTLKNELLMSISFFNQNLLWWSVVLFTVYASVNSLIIDSKTTVYKPQKYMNKVCKYIHYMPENWKLGGHKHSVLAEFKELYEPTFKWFLIEIFSIFLTPLVLLFSLPNDVEKIRKFLHHVTTFQMNNGDIVSFATFDFNKFGSSILDLNDKHKDDYVISDNAKMEKSYLFFKANYPNWKENNYKTGGNQLVESLSLIENQKIEEIKDNDNEIEIQTKRNENSQNNDNMLTSKDFFNLLDKCVLTESLIEKTKKLKITNNNQKTPDKEKTILLNFEK